MSIEHRRSSRASDLALSATGEPPLDRADARQREALEKLEIAYEATCSDAGFQAYLGVLSHLYLYSPRNVMLIFAQRPDATAVNAYDRWQDAGRQVRKGSQGITIFYPKHRVLEVENETTGEPEKRRILTGFGLGAIFDITDTDGPPIAPPQPPAEAFNTTADAVAVDRTVSAFLIGEGLRLEKKAMPSARLLRPAETRGRPQRGPGGR